MRIDERVAALLEAGEVDGAAAAAIEALGPAVLGYLASMVDEDDARDVFSRWAEDVWRGLPGFRFEASLRAWAFRLAWHAASRALRDPWRKRGVPLADSAALTQLDPQAMNGRDDLQLIVLANESQGQVLLAAVLDNLGKGAAGAAVQNLELMLQVG
jgi:DNA-directed RNA polymerase specialized sigma24 family protein